ncbi:hypothetical protein AK95_21195 [Paenibacillus sp. LC231]|nr:hypothetical protein AK95_21195 [Paenibacillus sp. LC231]
MKRGAPPKYTDKQLKDILLKYISKNPGKKINPLHSGKRDWGKPFYMEKKNVRTNRKWLTSPYSRKIQKLKLHYPYQICGTCGNLLE